MCSVVAGIGVISAKTEVCNCKKMQFGINKAAVITKKGDKNKSAKLQGA